MKFLFYFGGIAVGAVLMSAAFVSLLAHCSGLQGWFVCFGMMWFFYVVGFRFLKI